MQLVFTAVESTLSNCRGSKKLLIGALMKINTYSMDLTSLYKIAISFSLESVNRVGDT